ncbi:MAG: hypothetical protein ABI573_02535 [Chloroflexota bacterium]
MRLWLTCEWATTDRVSWFYPNGIVTLFGEEVGLDFYPEVPRVALWRTGPLAPYVVDPSTPLSVAHASDWTTGIMSFEHLHLDPEGWGAGPLPTPKESYEQPLGGDPAALDLAGSVDWTCGQRPSTVPTPGPADTSTPGPTDPPFPDLPNAVLTGSTSSVMGVSGCGTSWGTGGIVSGGESCGPSFQVLPASDAIDVTADGTIGFTLPAGYNFLDWTYEYVDQATAALYRGAEPPGVVRVSEESATTATRISVAAPPAGEWTIRFTFGATNGDIIVEGTPDYFRVIAR